MADREKVINHFQDTIEASGNNNKWRFVRVDVIEDAIELLKDDETQLIYRDEIIKAHEDEIERLNELLKEQKPIVGWISVKDRMPEEHPSMFAPLYGSEKWNNAMWRNESDRVLVTILFPDGTRTVDKGKLQDGKWKTGVSPVLQQEVTHWAVWPEPPKEEENEVD